MHRNCSLNEYIKKPLTKSEIDNYNTVIKPQLRELEKKELKLIYKIAGISFGAVILALYGFKLLMNFPLPGAVLSALILGFMLFLALAFPASKKLSKEASSICSLFINKENILALSELTRASINEVALPKEGKSRTFYENIIREGREPVLFERILIKELVLQELGGKDAVVVTGQKP